VILIHIANDFILLLNLPLLVGDLLYQRIDLLIVEFVLLVQLFINFVDCVFDKFSFFFLIIDLLELQWLWVELLIIPLFKWAKW